MIKTATSKQAMDEKDAKTQILSLLKEADAFMDWLAVSRMDLLGKFVQKICPVGFWGEKSENNCVLSPENQEARPVYLTFDDGPSPETTPWLLELLSELEASATFFLIGKEAEKYPDLVCQIQKAGHAIGNHSYSHNFMPILSTGKIENEVGRTNRIISEICGEAPSIFRPPFGLMCPRTARVLTDNALHPVYWSEAPEDWAIPGADRVTRRVLMKMSPGSLIVLHEGPNLKEQTIAAAKEIIYRCKSANLNLAKVELRA